MNQKRKELVLEPCRVQGCIPRIHRVVVYKEGCSYRVEPGLLLVHPEATVTFFSFVQSHDPVGLWFPKGAEKDSLSIPLIYQKPYPVKVGKDYGIFAYSVHIPGAGGGDFAEGGSPPRMIIADP